MGVCSFVFNPRWVERVLFLIRLVTLGVSGKKGIAVTRIILPGYFPLLSVWMPIVKPVINLISVTLKMVRYIGLQLPGSQVVRAGSFSNRRVLTVDIQVDQVTQLPSEQ